MDGVLVIDKPPGLTSHDVVAAARRLLDEPRVGHTGTLDPLATGVLPLVCGRATRLARFLSGAVKEYVAEIRFGLTTDTYDVNGREVRRSDVALSRDLITDTLSHFRGEYLQSPPPVSAKKIGGRRAHELVRAGRMVHLLPVPVSVSALDVISIDDAVAVVRVECSAGFYVRALAHAAGERAGTGACLQALRRTRSGDFDLDAALTLDALQRIDDVRAGLISMDRLLVTLPAARLTSEGAARVEHGSDVGPEHLNGHVPPKAPWVRLMTSDGELLAVAAPGYRPGFLHPSVVLG